MSHPPNAPIVAPSARCRSSQRGVEQVRVGSVSSRSSSRSVMAPTVACGPRSTPRPATADYGRSVPCTVTCPPRPATLHPPPNPEESFTDDPHLTPVHRLTRHRQGRRRRDRLTSTRRRTARSPPTTGFRRRWSRRRAGRRPRGKAGSVTTIPGAGSVTAERVVVGRARSAPSRRRMAGGGRRRRAAERVRKAAGAASRAVAGRDKVVSTLSLRSTCAAAAEGHLLGAYRVRRPTRSRRSAPVRVGRADRAGGRRQGGQGGGPGRAVVTAEAVAFARRPGQLGAQRPATRPSSRRAASAAARDGRADVEVLDEKALAEGGYGGILARRRRVRAGRRGWCGVSVSPAQSGDVGRAGRQGHHLRLRRHLDQARRRRWTR